MFGFRPNLSPESAILALKQTAQYYVGRMCSWRSMYVCFLDISSSFDLVSYDVLWEKMEEVGIQGRYITHKAISILVQKSNEPYALGRCTVQCIQIKE